MLKFTPPSNLPKEYSRLFTHYLVNRPNKNARFYLSEWFQALSEDALDKLGIQAELVMEEGKAHPAETLDLGALCKAIMLAESNGRSQPKNTKALAKKLASLSVFIALEQLSRKQVIKLQAPLSLSSNKPIEYNFAESSAEFTKAWQECFTPQRRIFDAT